MREPRRWFIPSGELTAPDHPTLKGLNPRGVPWKRCICGWWEPADSRRCHNGAHDPTWARNRRGRRPPFQRGRMAYSNIRARETWVDAHRQDRGLEPIRWPW